MSGGNCTRLAWNREILLGKDRVSSSSPTSSSSWSPSLALVLLWKLGVSVEEMMVVVVTVVTEGSRTRLPLHAWEVLLSIRMEETSGPSTTLAMSPLFPGKRWALVGWPCVWWLWPKTEG